MTTITLPRAVVEQALEALDFDNGKLWPSDKREAAITALEDALAERQTTHSAECWRWHHGCAVAKIERECKHE